MKVKATIALGVLLLLATAFLLITPHDQPATSYDVYQHAAACKAELGIQKPLPTLSCLDGTPVPIYVDNEEIQQDNWEQLSEDKRCDNPHWLGGDMGCWTYSHMQVLQLDQDNVMVLNCRQKGNQLQKNWFRKTLTNLGMNQEQRKARYLKAQGPAKTEMYYLYNTFNDIGIILRNTRSGKSCYFTQYGEAVVGFLPPLDAPLPSKEQFLASFNKEQARPPKDFPQALWYRDANQAFKSPAFTATSGCVACHNAHGFKYSPYINSTQGLPEVTAMAKLPFLAVGQPFIDYFNAAKILQVNTDNIDGEPQLCTRCHSMTTSGTCGYIFDSATDHPGVVLGSWLTLSSRHNSWMPPIKVDPALMKKHVAAMQCCCANPQSQGCQTRKFGPTVADLPAGFYEGKGWMAGQEPGLCEGVIHSAQWNAEQL